VLTSDQLQGLFRRRDPGHGGLGEEASAFQLPFLLLLQELASHQPGDRGVVGEDADHVRAAFDVLVEALKRVGAPDLAPVLLGEVQERQYVVSGGLHHMDGGGELLAQHLGDPLPVGTHPGLIQSINTSWAPAGASPSRAAP
jgi:hypothetical protein